MTLRHNKLRDITGALLEEAYHHVAIEPIMQPVTDNNLVPSTANTHDGVRLDVSARSFWIIGQKAFFDVRVFDPNSSRYQSKSLKQCFAVNEREKKRLCNRRILEVEHASFTPLIFTIYDTMGIDCRSSVSKLSELFAIEEDLPKSTVKSRVKRKINFALMRSMLICLRSSRLIKGSTMTKNDIDVQENLTKIKGDLK